MNIKRAVFLAVLTVAIASLAMPLVGLRASAAGTAARAKAVSAARAAAAANAAAETPVAQEQVQQERTEQVSADSASQSKISADILRTLGLSRVANPREASAKIGQKLLGGKGKSSGRDVSIQSGQPSVEMDARSALSDALITAIGGRDNQFSEVAIIADWDGREDCVAEREQKIDDFSFAESEIDVELTRTAISEHTVANGFNENVYYYGDSVGNLWVGTDTNPGVKFGVVGAVNSLRQINIPTLLSTGTSGGVLYNGTLFCIDDQVVVTGIAVNPVADLCDFGLGGTIGEVVYVSIVDTEGCVITSFGTPLPIRTRILEFAFVDGAGAGALTPAPIGARTIVFGVPVDFAGVAVDDDGSIYFQFADVIQISNGAAILKMAETPHLGACCEFPGVTRVIPRVGSGFVLTSVNVWQGTAAFPIANTGGVRGTNYSGVSTLFGDVIAISCGPCNVLFAAVSAAGAVGAIRDNTQGLFPAPTQFAAGTPSMVISFADCSGFVDGCSGQASFPSQVDPNLGGQIPTADGFADRANASVATVIPGVNNYRIFVQGAGPDLAPAVGGTAIVPGTPVGLLKISEFQVDYSPAHAGIAVSEEGTVFVISGGAPAGVGLSPSGTFGEVLCFEDICPGDRRADPVDLRTRGVFPNPGLGAGNAGDGVSDRFDHIFYQAPLDVNSATPAGLAGLNFGFLRYTNRLAPNAISPGVTLGQVGSPLNTVLGNDATSGPIIWGGLDPGNQVGGGDDQIGPFRGDDSNSWANPTPHPYPASSPANPILTAPLAGGFEFVFAANLSGATGTTAVALGPADGTFTFNPFLTSSGAAAGFPPSGELTITSAAGSEVVHYTKGDGVTAPINQFTIVRGQYGTVPRAHPPGAAVSFGNGVNGQPGCSFGVWNAFFWNSNGNITFGGGDTSKFANVPAFRQGLPKLAPAWSKLNPASRLQGFCNTFPVLALGFANVNAFKIRWINVPEEGREFCTANASNTFAITLYDDGTGFDENTAEVAGPLSVLGDNLNNGPVRFDQQEGPTDLRFTREPNTLTLVGCSPRPEGSGIFIFDYCRMDLIGTSTRPVLVGYSRGGSSGLNPPGLCQTNLSEASRAAEGSPAFGAKAGLGSCSTLAGFDQVLVGSCQGCCIGEGTEPEIFELFNGGEDSSIGVGGEITLAKPCFDLRFEGNDTVLCSTIRQRDNNRQRVCFVGLGCLPNPTCLAVIPQAFAVTPTTTGLVNAICQVTLQVVGCGFYPNETTTICEGFTADSAPNPLRAGKTVTTRATLACDTDGDGNPESTVALTTTGAGLGPINCNLIRATIPVLANLPGTGFPVACCGGAGTVVVTTAWTAGDNNVFGPFTRTFSCALGLGTRAPVVFSASPASGPCGICQDLIITGACFTTGAISNVFAQDVANPANKVNATNFQVLNAGAIDALFCFTSANAGKTFLIYVVGPGGTSRNLTGPVTGQPGAPCPATGNEQGIQVTFTCNAAPNPTPVPVPEIASVTGCALDRQETGQFFLDVSGTNIKTGATATVGGVTPKKIKELDIISGTNNPSKLRLLKKVCNGLPGDVIITNPAPAGAPSQPFNCTARCPTT